MKRFGRTILFVFGLLVAAWILGNLLLEVQLPDLTGQRHGFPDPMDPHLSLRAAFESLPEENGQETNLRLLDENAAAWADRWRLLAGARERLDICYFILKQDVFGMAFLGHLVQKAQEGLEIRVLLDAMGTKMSRDFRGNDYLDTLVGTEKIVVRMYRPLRFRLLDAFLTLNPSAIIVSNHDKILLADGRTALIGGRNISEEYFIPPEDDPLVFHDTDAVLAGRRIGASLRSSFEAQYAGGEAHIVEGEEIDIKDSTLDLLLAYRAMDAWLRGLPLNPETKAAIRERDLPWLDDLQKMPHLRGALREDVLPRVSAEVRLIDSRCRLLEADDFITRSLIRLVRSARREIFIQSPYLVLPKEAVDVLEEAGRRGVRITLLTNSPLSSDNPLSQGIFLEQWPELLARVPTMRIFVAGNRHNIHGKLAVFDRQLSLVGTYNLDPLSMALNSELLAAAWSSDFSEDLLRKREQQIAEGTPDLHEYRIQRAEDGVALRDREGRVVVAYGPDDHVPAEQMAGVLRFQKLYRWISKLLGDSPFF